MSRALRVELDGAVYHVMSRGVGRMRSFADDDEDRRAFLELVGGVVQEGGLGEHEADAVAFRWTEGPVSSLPGGWQG